MALESGHGCVVDNTNRDVATRKVYVTLARKLGKRIRCVVFDVDKERCNHNNLFRAYGGVPGEVSNPTLGISIRFSISSCRFLIPHPHARAHRSQHAQPCPTASYPPSFPRTKRQQKRKGSMKNRRSSGGNWRARKRCAGGMRFGIREVGGGGSGGAIVGMVWKGENHIVCMAKHSNA